MNRAFGNTDAPNHVTGKSMYVDDIPVMEGLLFVKVFDSPVAHGIIRKIDASLAEQTAGVLKIFSHKDIPGENQIGGIIPDEELLAESEVHFRGQPILLVVAKSEAAAAAAIKKIKIEIDPLPVITDPREAFLQGKLLSPSRKFQKGNTEAAFETCAHIFEGSTASGGQEHLYLETQGAYAYPAEHESVKVVSSTQGPTQVQRTIARVLGIGMNKVEVDVIRLGGGFGGKEDQASCWATMAALVAWDLKKPAKCVLDRVEDMRMTGKRNPYSSDYKIGLDDEFNIIAYEATFYQNGGAAADLSPAILERTLFHATNSYDIPNVSVTAHSCKTNLPPNTAFRGFGGPQGMFVIEAAIDHAAKSLGVDTPFIQRKNMMDDGTEFPYGQIVTACEAKKCWDEAEQRYDLKKIKKEINAFNQQHEFIKRGFSMMPVCFGISFTNTRMNQARALVHIYSDGSVGVSTGAVEMGQGVNSKMIQVAAAALGISEKKIKLETTNTTRVANTSPSAASSTSDLNGKAVLDACKQLMERLKKTIKALLNVNDLVSISIKEEAVFINDIAAGLSWNQLIEQAFFTRVNLSAHGHYSTPLIHFDKVVEKGHPFAYHVYGTALTTVTVDCLRGTYEIDGVHVVHDFGTTMNRPVDLGQCEGGIVQGIGWMTMEEVIYDANGKLLSNALSTYKIPDIYSAPKKIDIHFLNTDGSEMAIFKSKAVGEPPLMYGIGAFFAIRNAILEFNPAADILYNAPITPEKVLMALYSKTNASKKGIHSKRCWLENSLQEATVFFENGIITEIQKGAWADNSNAESVGDKILMPGIIDAHVHINEPGRTEWEGFDHATRAAAAGGITSLIDMPLNSSPVTVNAKAFQQKLDASKNKLHVNCGFYGGLIPGSIHELEDLIKCGVLGIKVFLVHSGIDEFPNATEKEIDEALPILVKHHIPLLIHCEIHGEEIKNGNGESADSYKNYLESRPKKWENDAVELMISLCRQHRSKTHIVHVSSSEALNLIRQAKEEGLPLTAETCPHYIYFSAEEIQDGNTLLKCAPPIREKSNNALLKAALAVDVLDFITTDHSPSPASLKELESGDFQKAWGGISGLQFLLPASWTGLRDELSLQKYIPLLTSRPAKFLGIDDRKGSLKVGYDADFVVWSPAEQFTVSEENMFSRHKISPYIDEQLFGAVHQTYVNGILVYDHKKVVHQNAGHWILRK